MSKISKQWYQTKKFPSEYCNTTHSNPQSCVFLILRYIIWAENLVKIVRKGFPGKNREILLTYPLNNIRSIGIKISEGLNPERIIYLYLKDKRKIPLTPVQQPDSISDLEDQAANLAKFLDLKLENL